VPEVGISYLIFALFVTLYMDTLGPRFFAVICNGFSLSEVNMYRQSQNFVLITEIFFLICGVC